jgi:hypothetical protein
MAKIKPRRTYNEDEAPAPRPRKRKQDVEDVPSRPAKKRKAAEKTNVKLKEIADAENDDSDESEVEDVTDEAVDEIPEANLTGMEAQVVLPDPPVVAPGFRLWETDSQLMARGGETMQITKVSTSSYYNNLRITDDA